MPVRVDSAMRMIARLARKSSRTKPWLLSISARGGPEIVVTEYRMPIPTPSGAPTRRSAWMYRRHPPAPVGVVAANPAGLQQNERQEHRVGHDPDRAWVDRRQHQAAQDHAGH